MKPCNNYISRASIKLTRLFFLQAKIYLASRLPFLQVFTNQELLTPFSLYSLHLHLELSHMLKTFSTLCSFPSPHLDRVFPQKKMQMKGPSLFLFWLFIPEPLLLPLPPSFFPHLALERSPSTSKTNSINTSHSPWGELLYPHLLSYFTTKNPYGFMVGCKEPEPRPKMDPKYFPRPIWSL